MFKGQLSTIAPSTVLACEIGTATCEDNAIVLRAVKSLWAPRRLLKTRGRERYLNGRIISPTALLI
ncbi:hypothetical protein BaRGS_00014440, partial [Batillaria attramentaria]